MPEFDSLHSYQRFEESVKTKARFVREDAVVEFLNTVLGTVAKRLRRLPAGGILFRAQPGSFPTTELVRVPQELQGAGLGEEEEPEEEEIEVMAQAPLPPDRMIPKAEYVGDGRVNPRGIPCLYLASSLNAVISEMRPWIGSYITIGKFKTTRECVLVDCSLSTMQSSLLESVRFNLSLADEARPEESKEPADTREEGVWGDIGFAFSKPVTRDEPHLDYVPTQILAEAFRDAGYDGIIYKSLLDKGGKNVALFDLAAAELTGPCFLYRTRSASFQCDRVDPIHDGYRAQANSGQFSWPVSIRSDFEEMPLL